MKKILFVGIGQQFDVKQRMTMALEKMRLPYVYARWSDLSFFGERIFNAAEELNLEEIGGVFFDIPRFSVNVKKGEAQKEIEYHLENELHTLLTILKEKNIYAPNRDFFLKHPYYNKFSQAYLFSSCGVAAIPTLHLSDNKAKKLSAIMEKLEFDFPLVAKESYGARGSKVWKIADENKLQEFICERRNVNVVFQPFIENNADYRVIVVNGKCAGIMKRSAKNGEWKNNFSLGGDVEKHEDLEMEKFAIEACKKMNLDIAGLDIFSTKNGYLVIEVNLFFGLDGFESLFNEVGVYEKVLALIGENA